VSCRWSFSGSIFCFFIYGRASLAKRGKSVVPMEISFMDMEDEWILVIGVCLVLINKAVTYYYKFYTKSPNQCRNLV
jgi:hypothetical protein